MLLEKMNKDLLNNQNFFHNINCWKHWNIEGLFYLKFFIIQEFVLVNIVVFRESNSYK